MLRTSSGAEARLTDRIRPSSAGIAVLAVALPLAFLHERWQNLFTVGPLDVNASDVAIAALWLACAVAIARDGLARLAPLRPVGVTAVALGAWIGITMVVERSRGEGYALGSATATAATFLAYAAFAIAPPLLVRSARDRRLLLGVVAGWGALAAAVGVAQFLGADILGAWPAGLRQPSFLGTHDFASLGALVGGLGLGLLAGRRVPARPAAALAVVGTLGLALSGAVAGIAGLALGLGLALAALATGPVHARPPLRAIVAGGLVLVVAGLGVLSLRGGDIVDFASFLGSDDQTEQATEVESYSQRTVLVYLGLRMFGDRPLTGVGWMRSNDPAAHAPYLDDARARFDVAEEGLPTPEHPYGIQNAYVQALADLGAPGALLFVAWLGACLLVAWRASRGPCPEAGVAALVALGVAAGLWAAEGIVPGVPLDALTWLAPGIAAAALVGEGVRMSGRVT